MSTEIKSCVGEVNFILDSGATKNLVCSSMEPNMTTVIEIVPVTLKVANDQTMVSTRQGKLLVTLSNEEATPLITIEAIIVEDLSHNLLSVERINQSGYKVLFESGRASIIEHNTCVISGNVINGLFVVTFKLSDLFS